MERRRFLQLAAMGGGGAAVAWFAGSPDATADVLSFSPAGQNKQMVFAESSDAAASLPHELLPVLLESINEGAPRLSVRGISDGWLPVQESRRYRLRIMNATGTAHLVSLRHHRFELARVLQAPVTGVFVGALYVERFNVVEADVVIRRPGAVFLQYQQPFVLD